MYNFFRFYTDIQKKYVFNKFDTIHITAVICIAISIVTFLYLLKKANKDKQKLIIKICTIAVPILELSHIIWLYFSSNTRIINLLPLHLCAMQVFFIPLAVFTNKTIFKDFIFATSILGGIFAIIVPSGVAGNYPFWHFQTLQTLIYHGLLIFIPIALIITTDYKPSITRFPKVVLMFLEIAIVDLIIDYRFDQNYLFLKKAPEMDILQNIQNEFGVITYLFVTFFALLLISFSIHIPFMIESNEAEKTKNILNKKII